MFRPAILIIILSIASLAQGDVIHLRSGGSVTGSVKNIMIGKQKGFLIDLGDGIRMSITQGDVVRIDRAGDKIAEYQQQLDTIGDDAEAHWQLARWCKANSLLPQFDRQVRHVIKLDPDHSSARAKLGYVKRDGKWVNHDRLLRSRGLVFHQGKWKTPGDVTMVETAKQQEIESKQWLQKIKSLRSRAIRNQKSKAGADALSQLQALKDPMASHAIGKLLREQKDGLTLRLLWVKLLSQWETPSAVDALIFASVTDPEPTIREQCFDRLDKYDRLSAVNFYISMLRNPSNEIVKKGGHALAALPDTRATFALIDAVVTTHKVKSGGGNNMNPTFDQSGGFSFGNKKEEVKPIDVPNLSVRSALMTLAGEGVDFQFDKRAWRTFFAAKYSDFSYSSRRDP